MIKLLLTNWYIFYIILAAVLIKERIFKKGEEHAS